jgi:hypothetical protein
MDNPCCPNSNRACFHDAPVWLRRKSLLLCRPKVISCWFGVYEGKTFKHGDKCYQYKAQNAEKCDGDKHVVEISAKGIKETEYDTPKLP